MEKRSDGFIEMEERYAGYDVYDRYDKKIGKLDDLFVDENDQPEYVGVKMGFLGTKSTLIPMEAVRVDEEHKRIEVPVEKDRVKEGPAFDDDWEITPPFEERYATTTDSESPRAPPREAPTAPTTRKWAKSAGASKRNQSTTRSEEVGRPVGQALPLRSGPMRVQQIPRADVCGRSTRPS